MDKSSMQHREGELEGKIQERHKKGGFNIHAKTCPEKVEEIIDRGKWKR